MVWIAIGSCVLAGVAVFALWRITRLNKELTQFKRETYYSLNRSREASRDISNSVEALKIQLACLASGDHVPIDLIQSGRLFREISSEEAQHLLPEGRNSPSQDRHSLFLDVGTQKDFSSKHIPGAILLPLEELESRYEQVVPRDGERIIVYCLRGDRSRLACEILSRHGYLNVYHLAGGLQQWRGPTIERESLQLIQVQSKTKELC